MPLFFPHSKLRGTFSESLYLLGPGWGFGGNDDTEGSVK